MDNGEAMPDNGLQTTDNGLLTVDYWLLTIDCWLLTVDYLTTLEIRGEFILVSRKKNNFFYRLTEPVFTGGVGVFAFLKTDEKVKRGFGAS